MKTTQGKLSHHFEQEAHQHTFTFMDSYNREIENLSLFIKQLTNKHIVEESIHHYPCNQCGKRHVQ